MLCEALEVEEVRQPVLAVQTVVELSHTRLGQDQLAFSAGAKRAA
jgi:hypothetical protein